MDNNYLKQLIDEANSRGGGLLLNLQGKPAAVVLTVEKYNQIISNSADGADTSGGVQMTASPNPLTVPKPASFASPGPELKKVLVTGGAGYIGAHLVRELINSGYAVTVLDNLSAGKRENIHPKASFVEGDLGDENLLKDLFAANAFYAVFHMAASIEVEESVKEPQKYYENNTVNTGKILKAMTEAGVSRLIFSSTAAVYGDGQDLPIKETDPCKPNNPYGYSKKMAEEVIEYYCDYVGMSAVVFRYFNACGFDPSAQISGTHFSHLIPIVLDVARGKRQVIQVNGCDYGTFDGSCVRDYVHVTDIVKPHILALEKMGNDSSQDGESKGNFKIYNIGTGRGSSVKEVINAASETLNKIIPMEIGPRRAGDAAITVADNAKLKQELGYNLQYSDLPYIIQTTWDNSQ